MRHRFTTEDNQQQFAAMVQLIEWSIRFSCANIAKIFWCCVYILRSAKKSFLVIEPKKVWIWFLFKVNMYMYNVSGCAQPMAQTSHVHVTDLSLISSSSATVEIDPKMFSFDLVNRLQFIVNASNSSAPSPYRRIHCSAFLRIACI